MQEVNVETMQEPMQDPGQVAEAFALDKAKPVELIVVHPKDYSEIPFSVYEMVD